MGKIFTLVALAGAGCGLFILYSFIAPYYHSLNSGEDIEFRIHELVNESRNKSGALPLKYDSRLAEIARAHSQDMIDRNYYSHFTPEGLDATARGEKVGFVCYREFGFYAQEGIGENLAQPGRGWLSVEDLAEKTFRMWYNSQEHRENMNERDYAKEGIGVAFTDWGHAYVTQNLC